MIDGLPLYISIVFAITTVISIGFLFRPLQRLSTQFTSAKLLIFLIPLWLLLQGLISISGFYLQTYALPPRIPFFGILPVLILIVALFIGSREMLSRLPLRTLTLLHIVRVPVEIVLFWLFQNGKVPQLMTFEGRNFDILAGITAPIIAWLAFRDGKTNRTLLIIWNLAAVGLLTNILVNAILSFPTPFQQFAFDQPNIGLLYFPFIWLPTIVVPIVIFSHAVSLWKLFSRKIENFA